MDILLTAMTMSRFRVDPHWNLWRQMKPKNYQLWFIFYVFYIEPAKVVVHPKNIWVEVGKEAKLSCLASGDKPITYRWYKNNDLIKSSPDVTADQADLVIPETIPADAQAYHCEVENLPDAEPDKSRSARIEIYSKLGTDFKLAFH